MSISVTCFDWRKKETWLTILHVLASLHPQLRITSPHLLQPCLLYKEQCWDVETLSPVCFLCLEPTFLFLPFTYLTGMKMLVFVVIVTTPLGECMDESQVVSPGDGYSVNDATAGQHNALFSILVASLWNFFFAAKKCEKPNCQTRWVSNRSENNEEWFDVDATSLPLTTAKPHQR